MSLRLFKWSFLACILAGGALAAGYRIDPAGGPNNLKQRVNRAAQSWKDAAPKGLDLSEKDDAKTAFMYGDGTRFGPDTLSLTLRYQPDSTAEVWLNPAVPNQRVLLHEMGLLAGLQLSDTPESVMNPAIGENDPAALGKSDRSALAIQANYAKEDVNQDGVVDFYDLFAIGSDFGKSEANLKADINEDGSVNEGDISALQKSYTFAAPSETAPRSLSALSGGGASGGSASGGSVSSSSEGEGS